MAGTRSVKENKDGHGGAGGSFAKTVEVRKTAEMDANGVSGNGSGKRRVGKRSAGKRKKKG